MLLKLYERNNNPADLQQVIDILNDGGIIIYPTDTMYAIGCHGLKERAIERICQLKNIDPKKNNLSIIHFRLMVINNKDYHSFFFCFFNCGNGRYSVVYRNDHPSIDLLHDLFR